MEEYLFACNLVIKPPTMALVIRINRTSESDIQKVRVMVKHQASLHHKREKERLDTGPAF